MKALISIDYTNDFVATDGKLTLVPLDKLLKRPLFNKQSTILTMAILWFLPLMGMTP